MKPMISSLRSMVRSLMVYPAASDQPARVRTRRRQSSRSRAPSLAAVLMAARGRFGARASLDHGPAPQPQPTGGDQQDDHDDPADELGGQELPADEHQQDDAELDDQVGGGKHEHHGGQEVSAAHEDRPGHGGGRVGTA